MTDDLTPAHRLLRARLASCKHRNDPEEAHARGDRIDRVCRDRFAEQVDPDHKLSPEERVSRARSARRAYFRGLALRSSRERAARRDAEDT